MHDEHDHGGDQHAHGGPHPKQARRGGPAGDRAAAARNGRPRAADREGRLQRVGPPRDAGGDRLLDARPGRPDGGEGLGRPGLQGPAAVRRRRRRRGSWASSRGRRNWSSWRTRPSGTTWSSARSARATPSGSWASPPTGTRAGHTAPGPCREPRAVLAEFGTELPAGVAVHVHDSTADLRYLVLPMRPPGTEAMSEEATGVPGHPRHHDRGCRPPPPLAPLTDADSRTSGGRRDGPGNNASQIQ